MRQIAVQRPADSVDGSGSSDHGTGIALGPPDPFFIVPIGTHLDFYTARGLPVQYQFATHASYGTVIEISHQLSDRMEIERLPRVAENEYFPAGARNTGTQSRCLPLSLSQFDYYDARIEDAASFLDSVVVGAIRYQDHLQLLSWIILSK